MKSEKLLSKTNDKILYLRDTDKFKDKDGYTYSGPCIVIFENGNVISYYDIKKNKYDINSLKEYFIEQGVIND